MRQRRYLWALIGTMAVSCFGAEEPTFSRDLTATIVLQGLPCDKVVQSRRNGDSDYTAVCHDGNRYHIFVDAKGRVVVQKL
ncbi:MAG TPA: hypothetical protein VMF64_05000 [Steroidobacteraceae bacterium]|nr:hypothetical protein [Steroidobacteraceae bacterium]